MGPFSEYTTARGLSAYPLLPQDLSRSGLPLSYTHCGSCVGGGVFCGGLHSPLSPSLAQRNACAESVGELLELHFHTCFQFLKELTAV